MKGVGCNRFSYAKWEKLGYFMKVHAKAVNSVVHRFDWAFPAYVYIDLFAGPGIYTTSENRLFDGDCEGSPIVAARALKGIEHRLFLNDHDVDVAARLTNSLNFEGIYCNLSVMDQADYVDLITSIKWRRASFPGGKKVYGLVFVDPNGCPPWDECEKLGACKQYDRLDLLIHVNATAHKRLFHHSWMGENMRLEERLRRIGKKHIFLWVPEGGNQWQFSLAFCTNWKEFPEFKRKGFYSIDSTEGRELLDRLQYTREELSKQWRERKSK